MEINRELDAWVAKNVFGIEGCFHIHWKYSERNNAVCGDCAAVFGSDTSLWIEQARLKHYTTDPAAAFEVLKKCISKCKANGNSLDIEEYVSNGKPAFSVNEMFFATSYESVTVAESDSLALAICKFAQKLFPDTELEPTKTIVAKLTELPVE